MKKLHSTLISTVFLLVVIFVIFHQWFFGRIIAGGDFGYYYFSNFADYTLYPYAWNAQIQNGFGGFIAPLSWIFYDVTIPILFGKIFGINWEILTRLFYLIPFLVVCTLSPLYIFKKIFPENKFFILAAILYLTNTYVLMMVGGGQIVGISLAYAILPFVLWFFMQLTGTIGTKNLIKKSVVAGLLFALLILLDLRFAYIGLIAIFVYFILQGKKAWKNFLFVFIIPLVVAFLLHAFWIIPVLLAHQNPAESLGGSYTSVASVPFFSFAKFEDSIALLHPYWPDNIFGKVGFLKPEFLLLPILAFSSLLFISKKRKEEAVYVLYFSLLGLLGIFLAKGSNDPFGSLYLWMFAHIPGFVMFRDPTKWYTLIALSYAMLIPFAVWKFYEWGRSNAKLNLFGFKVSNKSKIYNAQNLFCLVVIGYLIFLLRPAVIGQLSGTFREHVVPPDYQRLAKELEGSPSFYRTLWFPTRQRYGYSSTNHPVVSAEDLFTIYDEKKLLTRFKQGDTKELLENAGIHYVIIPDDNEKEIFLQDRAYSDSLYQQTYTTLRQIPWLHEVGNYGKIKIFMVEGYKDHFWSTAPNTKISYTQKTPVLFSVSVKNGHVGDRIVFAESYDSHWQAAINSTLISPQIYEKRFTSFVLPKDGDYTLSISYQAQKWTNIGLVVSLISFILSLGIIFFIKKK